MKCIEITETERAMYQEFYNIKTDKKVSKSTMTITLTLSLLLFIVATGINYIFNNLMVILASGIGLGLSVIPIAKLGKVIETRKINHKLTQFQQKYPDFDIDIDIIKVKEKLIEYRNKNIPIYSMSQPSKMSEEEKHLSYYKDAFRKMSKEEKIAFLEQEKEFWSEEREKHNEKQEESYQKKIYF